jgi:hypothetical protein
MCVRRKTEDRRRWIENGKPEGCKPSERNVVGLDVEIRIARLSGGRTLRSAGCRASGWSGTGRAAFCFASAPEQLEVFGYNTHPGAFLAGLFIVPGIELEASFDKDWPPLFEILPSDFSKTSPEDYIDVGNLFPPFAILAGKYPVNRHPNVCNRRTFRGVSDLRVASQISDQEYAVEIGHN